MREKSINLIKNHFRNFIREKNIPYKILAYLKTFYSFKMRGANVPAAMKQENVTRFTETLPKELCYENISCKNEQARAFEA